MELKGKKVVVMGLGSFGGGVGVVHWLHSQGAHITVTDLQDSSELGKSIEEIKSIPKLQTVFGEHRHIDFNTADMVITNPAVSNPSQNPYLQSALESGATITTEICLLIDQLDRENVIGVTGSAGKSTTAAMIYAALQRAGVASWLGGNIGGSLLPNVSEIGHRDIVVLELSSAMLWWMNSFLRKEWSPHISILTNVQPNHLDWHQSLEEYENCKRSIYAFQSESDFALSEEDCQPFAGLRILGSHNELNASLALQAATLIGADEELAHQGICSFDGLPHRLQRVSDNIYNDSKSTTPQATKFAVDAFENPSMVHLIVGGYDKQSELTLISEQSKRVSCLYTIGETGESIANQAMGRVEKCNTLECAITKVKENMKDGDVMLLSPGCASWDQFENYESRGQRFIDLVMGC